MVTRALAEAYELEDEIGRGGMGIVYRARDRRLKRPVAVKLLPPELAYRSDIRQRFMREAETSAQLNHPNIVPIFSVGEDERVVYFIMALVEGENLAKRLHDRGRLEPDEARRILREVADALAYAHARKVIHRDIKPDNILLDAETGRAMVTDFGIARAVSETAGSRLTATGMAIGTPAFMSPEQAAGDREIDGRSDLYSLGVVGYQMLCGELPFKASSTPAMLVKHLSEKPQPVIDRCPGLPGDVSRAVMVCLEKNPDDRFPSAAAMVVALQGGPFDVGSSARDRSPQAASPAPALPMPVQHRYPEHAPTSSTPTPNDLSRWNAPKVRNFRRKLAPYVAVNAVLLPMSIFADSDFSIPVVFWTIYMAMQYSKLWSAGYDWRDVFRQPRDRLFVDVAGEKLDEARAIWDEKKRVEVRAKARSRRAILSSAGMSADLFAPTGAISRGTRTPSSPLPPPAPDSPTVVRARFDRDEIHRLVDALPDDDKELIPDVLPSADALFERVQALSRALESLQGENLTGEVGRVEGEISELEAQANPLDVEGSERRIRRLAVLRRRLRALVDLRRRRDDSRSRLENCRLALENMRLDVLRLHSGAQSHQNVTLVAEQAMRLAKDVDLFVQAVDEARTLVPAR